MGQARLSSPFSHGIMQLFQLSSLIVCNYYMITDQFSPSHRRLAFALRLTALMSCARASSSHRAAYVWVMNFRVNVVDISMFAYGGIA